MATGANVRPLRDDGVLAEAYDPQGVKAHAGSDERVVGEREIPGAFDKRARINGDLATYFGAKQPQAAAVPGIEEPRYPAVQSPIKTRPQGPPDPFGRQVRIGLAAAILRYGRHFN